MMYLKMTTIGLLLLWHGFMLRQAAAQAYVELSPGSFTEASIAGIDASEVAWLFIVSNNERHLREITASVQARSETVELIILPGTEHATRILGARPDIAERIAVWLAHQLR